MTDWEVYVITMLFHAFGCIVSYFLGHLTGWSSAFRKVEKLRDEERARNRERDARWEAIRKKHQENAMY